MKTEVLRVNPTDPEPDIIARAADVLKSGGLVAFPTETVYGLGALAYDAPAVGKIFAAKGRPANNPLIVHLAGVGTNEWFGDEHALAAKRLAARFWPGPLTLVLPRHPCIPDIVTAGGPTMGIRMPDHAVAHALIMASGALAAPSANVSNTVSPTTAQHVLASLDGKIEMVLDGGPCPGGIESTVLDLTSSPPRVLRPGPILPSELREVIGDLIATEVRLSDETTARRSPGASIRHYSPRAALECYGEERDALRRAQALSETGKKVCWFRRSMTTATVSRVWPFPMPNEAANYAARLYDALHFADRRGMDYIVVNLPPDSEEWLAVRDRLRRAATVWEDSH